MKRKIYIILFTFLGILLSFILHGVLEIWYIDALTADFESFSLGFSWSQWFTIHKYFSVILFVLGAVFGFFQGKYWWEIVYEQKRFDPFFRKLRKFLGLN